MYILTVQYAVTPLEVVKTRLQTQAKISSRKHEVVSRLCYVFHNGLMTHVCKVDSTKPMAKQPQNLRPLRGAMVSKDVMHELSSP